MEETEGALKDFMEEIHQKNLRYARALKAGGPEVGIFWVVKGKLVVCTKPLSEGTQLGDIKSSSDTHRHIWKVYQQAGGVPKNMRHDKPPRGRVEYNVKTRQFHIIADRCILADAAILDKIKNTMKLPTSQSQTGLDEAYRCSRCQRREGRQPSRGKRGKIEFKSKSLRKINPPQL